MLQKRSEKDPGARLAFWTSLQDRFVLNPSRTIWREAEWSEQRGHRSGHEVHVHRFLSLRTGSEQSCQPQDETNVHQEKRRLKTEMEMGHLV